MEEFSKKEALENVQKYIADGLRVETLFNWWAVLESNQ